MRLKEIKPGMVIHCKNISEYERLEEETIKNGYGELPLHNKNEDFIKKVVFYIHDEKYLWGGLNKNYIEFSDLIIPELTAEEVLEICHEICNGKSCSECLMGKNCFIGDAPDFKMIVEICQQWKSDHEKKELEVEEFWEIKCLEDSNFHTSEHYPSEADALVMAKVMAKKDTENTYYAVRVFKAKAVE